MLLPIPATRESSCESSFHSDAMCLVVLVNMLGVNVELDGVDLVARVEVKESNRFMVPRLAYEVSTVSKTAVRFSL